MKSTLIAVLLAAGFAGATHAAAPAPADLDLSITYYSRVLTPEGVTRESRYEETMLRRPGHVWVERVLAPAAHAHEGHNKKVALKVAQHEHKHFNPVVIPRHVMLEKNTVRVEYIDAHDKVVVSIPKSEYDNVNFDGSWENSFYLLDPKLVAAMPLSKQVSKVAGARWREAEKNGVFQRVLWDEQKQIPLIIESGDRANTFYRRVDVKQQAGLSRAQPWTNVQNYAQREYSDYLD
ncbi:hypothetical protein [Janthinobacterium psychrotolerans]|uniref:Uncharacterized protein n=1 Tax=Janthinobacterium psychrotolerans TaxID=1747903 RepID=A0A1A7BZS5_9BURK|nr:hypothetical protein [Janthinobacterium psychrotolerans]OBV39002.1 hypothetical protein ASR47_100862 [Janthinobacterium psychrotolerans]